MGAFLDNAWAVWLQLAPWLLLGALAAAALHAWLPRGFVARHLRGRGGVLKAVALGVPLPLCSCGVIPAGLGLKKDGASDGAALGFLIATPQTGVDSALVSASFLGWPFALFKVAAASVLGVAGGLLVGGREREQIAPASDATERPGLRAGVAHGLEMVESIAGWLALGVLVSAALETWVPPAAFAGLEGPLGLLAVLGISLPLYVCATASVPIAAALVAGGFPPGAALVFLMAGPATNLATLGAVRKAFGGRSTAVYVAVLVFGSLGAGLLFDAVLPTAVHGAGGHEHAGPLDLVAGVVLLALVLRPLARELRRRMTPRTAPPLGVDTRSVEVAVDGMTCGSCAKRLEGALRDARGIASARVDLAAGRARVEGLLERDAVCALVEQAGFRAR
ncbi:MAG: permease [Myxococcota bacterium]